MNNLMDNQYVLRKQEWEDYVDDLVDQENDIITQQLNKTYNKRGYTLSDYNNDNQY